MVRPWIIQDWAGNTCFGGKRFKAYSDAWAFLYEHPELSEDDYQEYYVVRAQ